MQQCEQGSRNRASSRCTHMFYVSMQYRPLWLVLRLDPFGQRCHPLGDVQTFQHSMCSVSEDQEQQRQQGSRICACARCTHNFGYCAV